MIADTKESVAQYFEGRCEIELNYPKLSCVKAKRGSEVYIPMEALSVLPLQNVRRILELLSMSGGIRYIHKLERCFDIKIRIGIEGFGSI